MSDEVRQLIAIWRENPFHHFTQEEARKMFNIGEMSFRRLLMMPECPIVAKKVLPDHLKLWLWENKATIGKLTD